MTLIAYKYRLKPNNDQKEQFDVNFGHRRFVWNWALALRQRYYRRYGKSVSRRRLQDQLVKKKKTVKYAWLNDGNSQNLLTSLLYLNRAFTRFFQKKTGFPRFKSKYNREQTFYCPQNVEVDFDKSCVKLPKIGWVKAVLHRQFNQFEGKIKTATIKLLPSGKYQISILVKTNKSLPVKSVIETDKTLGIDLGIKSFLITCDGTQVSNPHFLTQAEKNLSRQQRILARKKRLFPISWGNHYM